MTAGTKPAGWFCYFCISKLSPSVESEPGGSKAVLHWFPAGVAKLTAHALLHVQVEKDRLAEQFDLQKTVDACQQLETYHAHTMRELSPDTEVSDIF